MPYQGLGSRVKAHLDGNQFRGNNFADAAATSGAIAEDVEALGQHRVLPLDLMKGNAV